MPAKARTPSHRQAFLRLAPPPSRPTTPLSPVCCLLSTVSIWVSTRATPAGRSPPSTFYPVGSPRTAASTASASLGTAAVRTSQPVSVTRQSSSMRIPIPANRSGTPSPGAT